jgi:sulfite exporter TauE/SafE
VTSHVAYHGGRLLCYAALGASAGALGSVLNLAGTLAGLADVAALLAFGTIVSWALVALIPTRWLRRQAIGGSHTRRSDSWFSRGLAKVASWPPTSRSLLLGLCTGLLPCGWLYAFVVSAAGTASPLRGVLVMTAFWAGSVPVLLGVGGVAQLLRARFGRHWPAFSAALLIGLGAANLWQRASSPLSLSDSSATSADAPAGRGQAPTPATCPHHAH